MEPSEEEVPISCDDEDDDHDHDHEERHRRPGLARSSAQPSKTLLELRHPSSLDFERIINDYSVQVARNQFYSSLCLKRDEMPLGGEDDVLIHGLWNASTYSTFDDDAMYKSSQQTYNSSVPPPPPPPPPPVHHHKKHRGVLGYTGRTATRWFLTNTTGLLMGIISIFIVRSTEFFQEWRVNLLNSLWKQQQNHHTVAIFVRYAIGNLVLALLSSALCLFFAPMAIGSGIPEVKAYLNGVRVKRFTSFRLFVVKIVATILSVSSGLTLGPEGPLVHIGAILGASCTKLSNAILYILPKHCLSNPRLWAFVTMDLSHFSTDLERRDLVSIGAATGFAAAFGAPIGGLLFSMEEASSYLSHSMFLKTLAATAIATFCLAVHHGDLSVYSVIPFGEYKTPDENIFLSRVEELPLFGLVAIGGGVLGGVFCRVWKFLQQNRLRLAARRQGQLRRWKLAEVAFVSILTSALTYFIPRFEWACRPVAMFDHVINKTAIADPWENHALRFDCPPGEINELATIFFGSREDAIGRILTSPHQFHPNTLLTVGLVFFPLMTLTLGVSLPSGIFMPTFLIGASLGGWLGMLFQKLVEERLPASTFALVGAAALLTGIQRSTVSICVILVEGTGQVKVLIPVIVTVVIARYIADRITPHGLYETAMEINHYPFLDHEEKKLYDIFQVRSIMNSPPVTLCPTERAQYLAKILRESDHNGFPVVDPLSRRFLGLIRRDQIIALLECSIFEEDSDEMYESDSASATPSSAYHKSSDDPDMISKSPLMHLAYHIKDDRFDHVREDDENGLISFREDDFDINSWLVSVMKRRETATILHAADHLPSSSSSEQQELLVADHCLPPLTTSQAAEPSVLVGTNSKGSLYVRWLNPHHKRKHVNLAAVMNRGTYCVNEFSPVSKAHHLFTALGLRHLIVLGGKTGGEVVGILTRVNLLKGYIEERTGCEL